MTQPEKPVSKWTALSDASRSLIERFRTWSIIIGLTLISALPVSAPLVWLFQGEVHDKQSAVLKAAEQPALFYLIVLFFFCDGLIWAHLSA